MRFLLRIRPDSGKESDFLGSVRSIAGTLGVSVRNPKWTSYGALEVDLFAEAREDVILFETAIEPLGRLEFSRDLGEAPRHHSPEEIVSEARELFNAERYWEAHEVLEGLWRVLTGDDKQFIQGVILVCAAFVHHQKGEEEVALGVMKRAAKLLAQRSGGFFGLDPSAITKGVEATLRDSSVLPFRI